MRVAYEYIRVTYEWHTSTYEWHTDDMRVTYGWHTSTYEWHTDDIQAHKSDIWQDWHMTYDIRVTCDMTSDKIVCLSVNVCSCGLHKKIIGVFFLFFILLLFFFLIWYFKSILLHYLVDTSMWVYHCISYNNVYNNWYVQYYYWYTDTFLLLHSS